MLLLNFRLYHRMMGSAKLKGKQTLDMHYFFSFLPNSQRFANRTRNTVIFPKKTKGERERENWEVLTFPSRYIISF